MSRQSINIGSSPNDGQGTPIRSAFDIVNQNFLEVYAGSITGVVKTGETGNFLTTLPANTARTTGNQTFSGTQTFSGNSGIVPVKIVAASGQVSDLLQAVDRTGKILASIDKTGGFHGDGSSLRGVMSLTGTQHVKGPKTFDFDGGLSYVVFDGTATFNLSTFFYLPASFFATPLSQGHSIFSKYRENVIASSYQPETTPTFAHVESNSDSFSAVSEAATITLTLNLTYATTYNGTFTFTNVPLDSMSIDISSNDGPTIAGNAASTINSWFSNNGINSDAQATAVDEGGGIYHLKIELLYDPSYDSSIQFDSSFLGTFSSESLPYAPAQGIGRTDISIGYPKFYYIDKITAFSEGVSNWVGSADVEIGYFYSSVEYPVYKILHATINDSSKNYLTLGNGIEIVNRDNYELFGPNSNTTPTSIYVKTTNSESYDPDKKVVYVYLDLAVR